MDIDEQATRLHAGSLDAVYALERLGQADPTLRGRVVEELCAYLRSTARDHRDVVHGVLVHHLSPVDPHEPVAWFWPDIDLDLSGAHLPDFALQACTIRRATFRAAVFTGRTSFRRCVFRAEADFSESAFRGSADFSDAIFAGPVSFAGTTFTAQPITADDWDVGDLTVSFDNTWFAVSEVPPEVHRFQPH
ncbi:pentapeptide repeat-containing protein [Actinokineospora sp. NBRC 105648]|uniref:pentapeptide repeat-containing protein n=1 Tax=Actinokineospora sp. NBRC 105648 TaxID=3032206 RepID=UPI0024A2DB97|nr:pentapeptide repeat-containing protein [Actinokineospora sp. NBRC 105648]GLZ39753.1 hypothetical protein Acsp05_33770 [Actinokineospora sp. NBRC 105648]